MKGILFKPDMIKAIVEGRKTQTRRVIKRGQVVYRASGKVASRYQVGEVIYIKEAFCIECYGESFPCYKEEPNEDCDSAIWVSPLFCPFGLARYFIKITDVRAEILQKITEEDALAEGCTKEILAGIELPSAKRRYSYLWDSTNKTPYEWQSNPWCFVYTFLLVDKQEGMR